MKRAGNIFEKICSIENIHEAITNAARGKKNRRTVAYVLENQDNAAGLIREMLVNKTYKPKPYRTFTIKDGPRQKERTIFCPSYYPDQIIHWALMQVLQPNIDNEVLKEKFRRKIKDNSALWLISCIVDSHDEGLPIGNYTSQWWANFYLQDLDHFIKEKLHIKRSRLHWQTHAQY